MRAATACLLVIVAGCRPANQALERMVDQPRAGAYEAVPRNPPSGTVSRDAILGNAEFTEGTGTSDGYPVKLTTALLERGRNRFDIYCAPCHGALGTSETPVADQMAVRRPPSLHEARLVALRPAQIYRVVHFGYGLMPSYDLQLSVEDRWAVVAYVKALQLSRSVPIVALPASLRQEASDALR